MLIVAFAVSRFKQKNVFNYGHVMNQIFYIYFSLKWMPSLCSHSESVFWNMPAPSHSLFELRLSSSIPAAFAAAAAPVKQHRSWSCSTCSSGPASSQQHFCAPLSRLCEASCKHCAFIPWTTSLCSLWLFEEALMTSIMIFTLDDCRHSVDLLPRCSLRSFFITFTELRCYYTSLATKCFQYSRHNLGQPLIITHIWLSRSGKCIVSIDVPLTYEGKVLPNS